MINITSLLSPCILFNDFSKEEITAELEKTHYSIRSFNKTEVVALEDSKCTSLGIVLSGCVEIQKIFASGKTVTIDKVNPGEIFGEVIIFSSKNTYPSSIISTAKSDVMFISKENILKLSSVNNKFLTNFMSLLSNKILILNKKVKNMSYQTIRQKTTSLILEEYDKQKNLKLQLRYSKKEMSEQLGIPRPSLSRELIHMKKDRLIDFNKSSLTIIDLETLETILLE